MSQLLDQASRDRLPSLYSTESEVKQLAQVKFFTPWSDWTWYAIEFDGEDLFFGLVDGFEAEYGYFSLSELENLRSPAGLRIERDEHFEPRPVREIKAEIDRRRAGEPSPRTRGGGR